MTDRQTAITAPLPRHRPAQIPAEVAAAGRLRAMCALGDGLRARMFSLAPVIARAGEEMLVAAPDAGSDEMDLAGAMDGLRRSWARYLRGAERRRKRLGGRRPDRHARRYRRENERLWRLERRLCADLERVAIIIDADDRGWTRCSRALAAPVDRVLGIDEMLVPRLGDWPA